MVIVHKPHEPSLVSPAAVKDLSTNAVQLTLDFDSTVW